MANDLTRNPWAIDTASATPILTKWVDIRSLQWVGAAAAGDSVVIQDQFGRPIWKWFAKGPNENFEFEFLGVLGRPVNGLTVPTISSGTLYISFAGSSYGN